MEKVNVLTDTTRFVNISDEPFDIYINKDLARHFEAGEEQIVPVFVAQVGSKHLADKVLFKRGIRDVNKPSPIKDEILSRIMPDMGEKAEIKPLTEEEFRTKIDETLKKQEEEIARLKGDSETKDKAKDKEMEKLKKELEALKKVAKKS